MRAGKTWEGRAAFLLAVGLVAWLGGCGRGGEPQGPDVVVMVNGEEVTKADLDRAWWRLPESEREQYSGVEGVKKLIDEIITYKLMAQEAERRQLDKDPLVKAELEVHRQRILVNALLNRALTQADIYDYFQRNFLRLRFIQIAFPADATEKDKRGARARAEEILKRLAAGAEFTQEALEHSEADNAAEGGEMGYVTYETLTNMVGVEAAERVRMLQNPGEITPPIEGKDGYYIFQLIEPSGKLDHRGLDLDLETAIRHIKREEVIRSFANELNSRKDNVIVYNKPVIDEILEGVRQAMEMESGNTAQPPPTTTAAPANGSTASTGPESPAPGEMAVEKPPMPESPPSPSPAGSTTGN